MGSALSTIAQASANPVAQRILTEMPSLADDIAENPFLSDEAFAIAYPNAKVPMHRARRLVTRERLTDAQFAHLLKVEKRTSVLVALVEQGRPADEWLDALLTAKAFTRSVADRIVAMYASSLPLQWLRAASEKVAGLARVELWLRDPSSATDDEIAAALIDPSPWCAAPSHSNGVKDALTWLLAARPGAIVGAARSTSAKVRQIAAGCRHLTGRDDQLASVAMADADGLDPDEWRDVRLWAFRALVWNPVVGNDVVEAAAAELNSFAEVDGWFDPQDRFRRHPVPVTAPFESLDDSVLLSWVLTRSLPRTGGNVSDAGPGRPWDLPAILANPHLTNQDLLHAYRRLEPGASEAPPRQAEHHPAVAEAFNTALAARPSLSEEYGVRPLVAHVTGTTWRADGPRYQGLALDPEWVGTWRDHSARNLTWHGVSPGALRYVEAGLADADEAAWRFALAMVEGGFSGTVDELVTVTRASA